MRAYVRFSTRDSIAILCATNYRPVRHVLTCITFMMRNTVVSCIPDASPCISPSFREHVSVPVFVVHSPRSRNDHDRSRFNASTIYCVVTSKGVSVPLKSDIYLRYRTVRGLLACFSLILCGENAAFTGTTNFGAIFFFSANFSASFFGLFLGVGRLYAVTRADETEPPGFIQSWFLRNFCTMYVLDYETEEIKRFV